MKIRTLRWCLAACMAVALVGAAAPARLNARGDGTLVVAQSVPVTALDPAGPASDTGSPAEEEAAVLIYDGLVRLTDAMKIVPELASGWSVAQDGRTWTFKIRGGVVFHDGTSLTARAVADDFQRELDPQTNPSNRALWDPLASVSVPDASTVQIVTKEPFAELLNTLADASALIASPAAVEKWGAEYKVHPAGTGPYEVDRWDAGTQIEVTRNPRFWGAPPGYDRIVLRAVPDPATRAALLRNGQVEVADGIAPEDVEGLHRLPAIRVIVRRTLRTFGMAINLNRPVLQDIRVRLALNYAVDKDLLVKALFRGYANVLHAPIAEETPGFVDLGPWAYDPPRARRLLEDAGWHPAPPIGIRIKDGTPLEVVLLTPVGAYPHDVEVVETLADYLRNVGFGPHFTYAKPDAFRDDLLLPAERLKWDLTLFGFSPSDGGAGDHLNALYESNADRHRPPGAYNITWYANPQVDAALEEASHVFDPWARAAVYARVERQVWNDAPYLWLYAEQAIVGAAADVHDVEVLPTGITVLKFAAR